MGGDTVGHERVDVHRQVGDRVRTPSPSELAEGEDDGHPAPDALCAEPLVGEPDGAIVKSCG